MTEIIAIIMTFAFVVSLAYINHIRDLYKCMERRHINHETMHEEAEEALANANDILEKSKDLLKESNRLDRESSAKLQKALDIHSDTHRLIFQESPTNLDIDVHVVMACWHCGCSFIIGAFTDLGIAVSASEKAAKVMTMLQLKLSKQVSKNEIPCNNIVINYMLHRWR